MWERRYEFPAPARDEFGERIYPMDQIEKLCLIKTLMDQGFRPGKIVGADMNTLRGMTGQHLHGAFSSSAESAAERQDLLHYIALCKAHQVDELRHDLSQSLLRLGIYRFVIDMVAPLTAMVGAHWANGNLAVFEEHLYTESLQAVLRNAIASIPPAASSSGTAVRPRILLTTAPQEHHGLGLLMAEAIFALEGARCISLGVQMPIMEIARAAQAHKVDIVALSFSASVRSAHVLEALSTLRAELPPATEIWVGGRCPALQRKPPATAKVLELHEISDALAGWRRRCLFCTE